MRGSPRAFVAAAGEVAGWWLALTALYLVLITPVTVLEFVVGAAGAALAACAARAARIAAGAGTGGRRGMLTAAFLWPGAVLGDTVRFAAAIGRALRGRSVPGRLCEVRLRPGTGAAWAGAALSATPGAYVVDVRHDTHEGDVLTVHVLTEGVTALERALTTGGRG